MPTPKPPYPAAFRQQIVELVSAGRGITELAREFGCTPAAFTTGSTSLSALRGAARPSPRTPR